MKTIKISVTCSGKRMFKSAFNSRPTSFLFQISFLRKKNGEKTNINEALFLS